MRLVVRLLGREVLAIDIDPTTPESSEADGTHLSRHSGDFEIGFTPLRPRLPGDVEASRRKP